MVAPTPNTLLSCCMGLLFIKLKGEKENTYCFPRLPGKETVGLTQWFPAWGLVEQHWHHWELGNASLLGPDPPIRNPQGRGLEFHFAGPPGDSNAHPNTEPLHYKQRPITGIRIVTSLHVERGKHEEKEKSPLQDFLFVETERDA